MRSSRFVHTRAGAARSRRDDDRRRSLSCGTGLGRAVSLTAITALITVAAIVLSVAVAGYASDTGVRDAGTTTDLPQPAGTFPSGPDRTPPERPPVEGAKRCPPRTDAVLLRYGAPGHLPAFAGVLPSLTGTARTLP